MRENKFQSSDAMDVALRGVEPHFGGVFMILKALLLQWLHRGGGRGRVADLLAARSFGGWSQL